MSIYRISAEDQADKEREELTLLRVAQDLVGNQKAPLLVKEIRRLRNLSIFEENQKRYLASKLVFETLVKELQKTKEDTRRILEMIARIPV